MDASDWDGLYKAHESHVTTEPNRFVREQCERLPVGVALDLACGEGQNALWLAQLGWRVTGVDFSAVAIQRARDRTAERSPLHKLRLEWRVADVRDLAPKPLSLDLVLASYVHVHHDELDAMLKRAAAALRPGGHLVVVAHNKQNLTQGVFGPFDQELLYEPEALRSMLSGTSLVIEVARTFERVTAEETAVDTVLRARRDEVR